MKKLLTLIIMLFSVDALSHEPIYLECHHPNTQSRSFTLYPDKDEVRGEEKLRTEIFWSATTVTIRWIVAFPVDTYRINRETLEFTYRYKSFEEDTEKGQCEIIDTNQI